MAQKVNVILVDDIDGSDAVETVSFGVDGTRYEIDLNSGHAQDLREQLDLYVRKARKVTGPASRAGRGRRTGANDARNKEIRDWAREGPGCQRARSHPRRHRGAVRGGKRQVNRAPDSPGPVHSAGLLTRVRPADGNPLSISGARLRIPFIRDKKTRTASRIPGPAARVFTSTDHADLFGSPFRGNARNPREGR